MPVTGELLRKFAGTFGQEITTELVNWANEVDTVRRAELKELAEGYYLRLHQELEVRDSRLHQELEVRNARLHQELEVLQARLQADHAVLRAELIKWMFTLWAGSAVTTVATVWGVVSLLN